MDYLTELKALDRARWRMAIWLTMAMMAVYFGFILLVAYEKPLLTSVIIPGLSVGILLGALVIVAAWVSSGSTSDGPISTTTRGSRR